MGDIKVDIINPVRPYILFEHKEDGFCGYVDTSNMACGVIPVDVIRERYIKHKEEMEEAYAQLQGWIKPLWDKWLAGGNDNREWLINTPIDQLVVEDCPDAVRQTVENLKALAIFYKYSSRKIEGDSYVEMYGYGRKKFTAEEITYIRRGEQLDISNRKGYFANVLFRLATNDDKPLTDIEKHLYEIKPHHHHLFQLEIDKVKHLITTESRYYGKNDWMGFVLDNPTKERLKEVQDWVDSRKLGYLMLFGATQQSDGVHYKVMYLVELWDKVVSMYRDGCYRPSGFLSAHRFVAKYSYNRMDFYENRKGLLDYWKDNVAGESDYCLLKRGKTLDVLKRDRLVSGVTSDTSFIWPYLKPDLRLADNPEAQYYCYIKAYSGSFDDEKRQELLEVAML